MRRGEVWWASLPQPVGSGPGFRRPVVIVQANSFNASGIRTVIIAPITSNLRLADVPGNLRLTGHTSGLRKGGVVNVSQILSIDRSLLTERVGKLTDRHVEELNNGLRLVLAL